MHFSGSCKRDVCLFDNTSKICHWMGFKQYKKCRLSYFYNWLYLCILYQWNFLYWRLKDTSKKKKKKNLRKKTLSGLVVWPDPDWSPSMISSWHQGSWLLIIRFSRRSLALFLSLLFPHLSVVLSFSLSFSFFLFFNFPEKQEV